MAPLMTLERYLEDWARTDEARAVAETILAIAGAGKTISGLIAQGPLAGSMGTVVANNADGDTQKELDRLTNIQAITALKRAPVAFVASEELDEPIATGNAAAPLCVAIDPLDGSSNIDTNVSVGTIFSILPLREDANGTGNLHFFQPGTRQLAAGYIIYGPHSALVLTVGQGTHIFTLDPADGKFKLTIKDVQIPRETREFAINTSNYRHWDEDVRQYIDDCLEGAEGPRGKNFNTRWIASMVAECHRILMRGGIYLYPGDARQGYQDGRLRLIYEGNPIAFLMEQAGGAASTGRMRIVDVEPTDIHQRVPLIFGSADEVETVERYVAQAGTGAERSPLFGRRGLFRT
jgi:fructose-1,6-bisphosphatase I